MMCDPCNGVWSMYWGFQEVLTKFHLFLPFLRLGHFKKRSLSVQKGSGECLEGVYMSTVDVLMISVNN